MPSERFYAELPEIERFRDVVASSSYTDVPEDWCIIVTDVRGSTKAIEAGRYKDVNALGASTIVGLKNALPDLEIPFVFGGDGATLLVPRSVLPHAESALRGLRALAERAFDMSLRCAVVEVAALRAAGHEVKLARFRSSPHVALAMLMGSGFSTAERWVKDPATAERFEVSASGPAEVSLEGFECRWRPIKNRRGTMLALLVQVTAEGDRVQRIYTELLDGIEAVLGEAGGSPVSRSRLKIGGPLGDYSVEARVRSGQPSGDAFDAAFSFARKKALIGKALIATGTSAGGFDGASYKSELVANCDFRKFDEVLRMVLDVSERQCRELATLFDQYRARGEIAYGMHRSPRALMTCFVRSFQGDHIHFIDGADGGYALAAKQLKAQLR